MDFVRRIASRDREVARLLDENAQLRPQLDAERSERAHERHAAHHDPLTGLPNRRDFYQRARSLLAESWPVAAMMLDLDEFKPINDRIGHAAGDVVLVAVARRLAGQLGDRWLFARLGGDEFAALRAWRGTEHELVAEASALEAAIAAPVRVGHEHDVRVRCSIGLAVADPAITLPELLRRADAALYRSKTTHSMPVVWHPLRDDSTGYRPGERPALRTRDLRRARFGGTSVLVAAGVEEAGGPAVRSARAMAGTAGAR